MSEQEFQVRVIVVPVDATPASLAAFETAAELAARMQAEIRGLFVEDIGLLRLAASPLARTVHFHSLMPEHADAGGMERALRVQAERARQCLALLAERLQLRWSFQISRGEFAETVLGAASEADLVAMEKTTWLLRSEERLGRSTPPGPRASLLLRAGAPLKPPVVALYGESDGDRDALAAAASMAQAMGSGTIVLVPGLEAEARARLVEQVTEIAGETGLRVECRCLTAAGAAAIARAVRQAGAGVLVLSARCSGLDVGEIQELLEDIDNAVLLVR